MWINRLSYRLPSPSQFSYTHIEDLPLMMRSSAALSTAQFSTLQLVVYLLVSDCGRASPRGTTSTNEFKKFRYFFWFPGRLKRERFNKKVL